MSEVRPCKRGHETVRNVRGDCIFCVRERAAAWAKANPERHRENARRTQQSARAKARSALYREKNRERLRAYKRDLERKKISDRLSYLKHHASRREKANAWKNANKGLVLAEAKARKLLKISRTPKWLTEEHKAEMQSIYAVARMLRQAGLDTHVDHIVPLRGKTVSGLHVPWNLQLLDAKANLAKRNKLLV